GDPPPRPAARVHGAGLARAVARAPDGSGAGLVRPGQEVPVRRPGAGLRRGLLRRVARGVRPGGTGPRVGPVRRRPGGVGSPLRVARPPGREAADAAVRGRQAPGLWRRGGAGECRRLRGVPAAFRRAPPGAPGHRRHPVPLPLGPHEALLGRLRPRLPQDRPHRRLRAPRRQRPRRRSARRLSNPPRL
ncbi:MAG: hypothetical protein AVDCRST_MAG68-3564, partial [uncultured Gemmatimonadetes bacterium]